MIAKLKGNGDVGGAVERNSLIDVAVDLAESEETVGRETKSPPNSDEKEHTSNKEDASADKRRDRAKSKGKASSVLVLLFFSFKSFEHS